MANNLLSYTTYKIKVCFKTCRCNIIFFTLEEFEKVKLYHLKYLHLDVVYLKKKEFKLLTLNDFIKASTSTPPVNAIHSFVASSQR